MYEIKQGDVIKVENIKNPVFVVSNDYFNSTEAVVVCPMVEQAEPSPLHIEYIFEKKHMYILTEQLKYLNLSIRGYSIQEHNNYDDIFDIIDTIQGIFEQI